MRGEEAARDAGLIGDEEAKCDAEKAGRVDHAVVEDGKSLRCVGEGDGYRGSDQHHSSDGAEAENEQVSDLPPWLFDGRND